MLGLPRQAARVQEEISEDLLASIPIVGKGGEEESATVFVPVADDEVIAMPPSPAAPAAAGAPAEESAGALGVAAQLRYQMAEALARELDRAEQSVATALADFEGRIASLEEQLAKTRAEAEEARKGREHAERKLKAFKELAKD